MDGVIINHSNDEVMLEHFFDGFKMTLYRTLNGNGYNSTLELNGTKKPSYLLKLVNK